MPLLGFVELPSTLRVMVVLVVVVDQTCLRCTITILETTLGRRGGARFNLFQSNGATGAKLTEKADAEMCQKRGESLMHNCCLGFTD